MDYEKRLLRVMAYVRDNPASDLSLDALAEVAALSRFHFHRVFRAVTGETVSRMVRRVRMERAAVMLTHGAAPIADIARGVGYPNVPSFTRAFADVFGQPPGAFRHNGGVPAAPPIQQKGDPAVTRPIIVRSEPARRLAALAHKGPYPEIGPTFDQLFALLSARGQAGQVRGIAGVFYDDPSSIAAADLTSHAGALFGADIPIAAPLDEVLLPAGRHAVMTHKGPYAGLTAAYDELYCSWLPGSGEEPADTPVFEVYLNTPMDVAQADLITEICLPLKG